MVKLTNALALLSTLSLATSAAVHPPPSNAKRTHIKRSNTVTTASSLADQSFDYVIVVRALSFLSSTVFSRAV